MKKIFISLTALLMSVIVADAQNNTPNMIEVTGSATLNIIPDRISIEIGMEEYFKQKTFGDSTIVKLADIEKRIRKTLRDAGVPDSHIIVSDLGNYRDRDVSATFLMAKRLSATVSDFSQIEYISDRLDRNGITAFNITKTDCSDMAHYNREGLKSALDAARQKAEFIAENEGLQIIAPYEIIETTGDPSGYSTFSNVAYSGGSGMENLRRIVRRYSVKVRFIFSERQ
ncbi:SIMPL domain-containing protein [Barnesiella sp. WM24]|uniref:SIMPL domain-containing protein n=1 Tax=Barnesiella sp. WM24 TaxID=2558278 RepID=UPI001071B9DD|nr:SIMPL domain-containing protein [Barnesiella sp. WM24]TFU94527.1 SIMPL domain-containing protein [Barnesiella sp. WM24]